MIRLMPHLRWNDRRQDDERMNFALEDTMTEGYGEFLKNSLYFLISIFCMHVSRSDRGFQPEGKLTERNGGFTEVPICQLS